jgi:hypothetical protein
MSQNKPGNVLKKTKPKGIFRSRVTAGLTLLPSIDGRSTWARIMRDTYHAMIAHSGGADYISEPRRLLARRVAACEAELISLEDKFARIRAEGGAPGHKNLDLYGRLAGQQRRCLEALGLDRTARDITPSPLEYARQIDSEDDIEDAVTDDEMEDA